MREVQILGGVGNPSAKVHANRLTGRFADLLGGTPVYLPAPGVLDSATARKVLLADAYVRDVIGLFDQVTTALVGIGAIEPSKLLAASGNIFPAHDLELLRSKGAVGDVLLRFFDAAGKPVDSPLNERVVSMRLDQLARVDRSIGVAGGARNYARFLAPCAAAGSTC